MEAEPNHLVHRRQRPGKHGDSAADVANQHIALRLRSNEMTADGLGEAALRSLNPRGEIR